MNTIYLMHYTDPDPTKRHITEHLLGRQLLSYGLEELYGLHILPDELNEQLEKGIHGKPSLTAYPHIHFNICHCRNLIACVFSDHAVGIDAENIRSFKENVLRKILSPSEQEIFQTASCTADREELFFRFWTLKESRIKESGTGMAVPLTDFSFEPDIAALYGQVPSSIPELNFWQWKLDSGHILSLCTADKESEPSIRSLQSDTFPW